MLLKSLGYRLEAALDRLLAYPLERRRFKRDVGYWPRLRRPRSYNEKIVWRKLFDRNPQLARVTDKWLLRGYAIEQLGRERAEEHLVPLYGLYNKPEAMTEADLARPCVIKPTHSSGRVMLFPEGLDRDIGEVRERVAHWLAEPAHRIRHHEWAYSQLKPRVMVEAWLEGENGQPPPDYKFLVFGGRTRLIQVHQDRFGNHCRSEFDRDWRFLEVDGDGRGSDPLPCPERYPEMLALAERLAQPFDFMRVDLYLVGGRIYLGELTAYPGSGRRCFDPSQFDFELGRHWRLPGPGVRLGLGRQPELAR
ncbi:ATP-grasp fold amidoligase family protein [Gammaproteobacteria bacterium AB-CW1]|uniref:ATP-grasp fold amidoligase family protein n=1 Tax=Natronospira elongata TaxID=3110268 RepID=A0AAP6MKC0_9GAMM|nr:ATP-grasp fold amidoligase family protein [Gammaproteobacteria bacterium AB-CW1]